MFNKTNETSNTSKEEIYQTKDTLLKERSNSNKNSDKILPSTAELAPSSFGDYCPSLNDY